MSGVPGPIPVRSRPSTTSNNIENFVPDGEVDSFLGEGEEESEEEEEEESEEDEEERLVKEGGWVEGSLGRFRIESLL